MPNTLSHPPDAYAGTMRVNPIQLFGWYSFAVILNFQGNTLRTSGQSNRRSLAPGMAMEIPLAGVGGIGLANLRSAVHRGAISHGLEIETLADEKNFYVWKKKVEKLDK